MPGKFITELQALVTHIWSHPANTKARVRSLGRLLYWQLRKRLLQRPMVINTVFGRRFIVMPDSKFSSLVYYTHLPDWDEMNFLLRVLRRGDGFLDIGANVGFYTLLASAKTGPSLIHAFEANPANVKVLREQIALNDLPAINIHACALGGGQAVLRFRASDRETGAVTGESGQDTFEVEARMLDQLIPVSSLPTDTFGKIDVEGYEVEILLGAQSLLAGKVIAVWVFELSESNLNSQNRSVAELLGLFKQHNYVFYVWDESARVLSRVNPENMVRQNYIACCRGETWLRQRLAGAA